MTAVVVYRDRDFRGGSQSLGPGRYDMGQLTVGNDGISSLQVPDGWTVTLYENEHFQGRSKTFTSDAPHVGDDFDDSTSSLVVTAVASAIDGDDEGLGLDPRQLGVSVLKFAGEKLAGAVFNEALVWAGVGGSDPAVRAELDALSHKVDLVLTNLTKLQDSVDALAKGLADVEGALQGLTRQEELTRAVTVIRTAFDRKAPPVPPRDPRAPVQVDSLGDLIWTRRNQPDWIIDVRHFQDHVGRRVVDAVNDIAEGLTTPVAAGQPSLLESWVDSLLRHVDTRHLLPSYVILEQQFQWYVTHQLQGINTVLVSYNLSPDAGRSISAYLAGVWETLDTEIQAFLTAVERLVLSAVPPVHAGFGEAPQWPVEVLTAFRRCDLIAEGLALSLDPARKGSGLPVTMGRLIGRPSRRGSSKWGLGTRGPLTADGTWSIRDPRLEPAASVPIAVVDWQRFDDDGCPVLDPHASLVIDRVRAPAVAHVRWDWDQGPAVTFPPPEARRVAVPVGPQPGTWQYARDPSVLPLRVEQVDLGTLEPVGQAGPDTVWVTTFVDVSGWVGGPDPLRGLKGDGAQISDTGFVTHQGAPRIRAITRDGIGMGYSPSGLLLVDNSPLVRVGFDAWQSGDADGGFDRRIVFPLMANAGPSPATVKVFVRSTGTTACLQTPYPGLNPNCLGAIPSWGSVTTRIEVSTGASHPVFASGDRGLSPSWMYQDQPLGPVTWPPPDEAAVPGAPHWVEVELPPGARCSLTVELAAWFGNVAPCRGDAGLHLDYSIHELLFAP
jgi:hypothetical protein